MLLWIIVVLVLLITWAGGYLATSLGYEVPLWVQIAITVALALFVVGLFLYRRWRAKAAARALEQEILRQSEQQAIQSQPDKRAEVEEIRRQIEQGIERIKKSKLGKARGGSALYALPWYVIIGPPGAGKTTALRHSGLDFAYLSPDGGGLKGAGGTRNCEWWFSSEAILLDTAGRWSVEASDREEWLSFLQMLRRFRPKQPLNGLILAVSVDKLIESSAEQLQQMANDLRARIDEVITDLGVVLPVYLMLSKADLLAGFVEFFGDLRLSERHQVFGASLSEIDDNTQVRDTVSAEFGVLLAQIQSRLVERLGSERHEQARQRVYQFGLELQAIRQPLVELIQTLFQKSGFREQPNFRGFYFTSGTQEGRPLDRVIAGMARAFGLKQAPIETPVTEPKSYFVTDLFRRVIFPESQLAARTVGELRRQRVLRIGFAVAAGVLALFILVPSAFSFANNRALVRSTLTDAKTAKEARWDRAVAADVPVDKLSPIGETTQRLRKWNQEGPPLKLQFGMYVGDTLYPGALHAWLTQMDSGLIRPLRQELETKLDELGRMQELPIGEYSPNYELLKVYLLLSMPDRLEADLASERPLAVPWMTDYWKTAYPGTGSRSEELMAAHLAFYLDLIVDKEIRPWDANPDLVHRARDVLSRIPVLERNYEMLVKPANDANESITYADVFDGAVSAYVTSRDNKVVEGAYTRGGWDVVKAQLTELEASLDAEAWVLGDTTKDKKDRVQERVSALRAKYFETYLQEWLAFLGDFEVHRPESAQQALKELNALSELPYPYERLLMAVRDRAIIEELKPPEDEKGLHDKLGKPVDKALGKVKGAKMVVEAMNVKQDHTIEPRQLKHMRRVFMPLANFLGPAPTEENPQASADSGLYTYQGMLSSLIGVLEDLEAGDTPTDPQVVAEEFEKAYRSAGGLLAQQNGETRPILSPLLLNPISFAWGGVVSDAGGASEGLWEVEVWEKWQARLADKYPFTNTADDVAVKDFAEFFNPKTGVLWGFYDAHLKSSLRQMGPSFQPVTRFSQSVGYRPDFLQVCLQRGAEITEQAFEGAGEAPLMTFSINLHSVSEDVSEVRLEIDGVAHVYQNAPEEWITTTWPAKEPEVRGGRVRVRGFDALDEELVREGDFGFFRLLDAADIEMGSAGGDPNGEPTFVATWALRTRDAFVKLDIRPGHATQKLNSQLFMDYDCPRNIRTGR
jgi:type VI secretion system protein ImpL